MSVFEVKSVLVDYHSCKVITIEGLLHLAIPQIPVVDTFRDDKSSKFLVQIDKISAHPWR